jgi:phosphoribosylamine--glycine ligase
MRVLVIGSGGREHALCWAIVASPLCDALFSAPGNPGIAEEGATCVPVAASDVDGILALCRRERIDFVVVGPEVPLVAGLVDRLEAAGVAAFGPSAAASVLESSKGFTKDFCVRHGIPTAAYGRFGDAASAAEFVRKQGVPIVVKADGLAAGKGVTVAMTVAEALAAVNDALVARRFGAAGAEVVVEEFLEGEEASFFALVDGRHALPLATAQDHKRVGDGDTGPNTGGMGAYSPAGVVTPDLLARIEREIVRPSVDAIAAEGIDFRGTLFIGLMLTATGPSVIEYNARFGDPETQAVLPRLASDLLGLLWAAAQGELGKIKLTVNPGCAICVVLAARGYPEHYPKGEAITLPAASSLPPDTFIFHAGTARDAGGSIVTAGGRVLGVTALAPTLGEAAERAYAVCNQIQFASKYFRRDIGARQLNRS